MRNEIKLRFEEPQYIIQPQNGVVICKLSFFILYPQIIEDKCCPLYRKRTVKAIAKVGFDDTFDELTGMKVSLAKAEQKAYLKVGKTCTSKMKELFRAMSALNNFCLKANSVIEHNDKYINKF